jgi:hypothetical protein
MRRTAAMDPPTTSAFGRVVRPRRWSLMSSLPSLANSAVIYRLINYRDVIDASQWLFIG